MRTIESPPSQQGGSALIISLVVLAALAVLSVTGMRTSRLEETMSANALQQNISFQAAESAMQRALGNETNLNTALVTGDTVSVSDAASLGAPNVIGNAVVGFLGQGPAPGYSVGVNKGSMISYKFVVESTGRVNIPGGGVLSESRLSQGAYRVAPGGY